MSYSTRYYNSNKINIYNNNCYIPLPYLRSCPPPPSIYLAPTIIYPSSSPHIPLSIQPAPVPINHGGSCSSSGSCGSSGSCSSSGSSSSCGPCGR